MVHHLGRRGPDCGLERNRARGGQRLGRHASTGDYVLTSSGPDQVVAYMTLTLEPLGPMRAEGHLFATFGLIVLAFADRGIRRWLESREVAGSAESIPIGFRGVTPLIDEDPVHVDGQWKPPMRG